MCFKNCWLSLWKMPLSDPIMKPWPVINEAVYLWNVPYSCCRIILQISELKLIPRKTLIMSIMVKFWTNLNYTLVCHCRRLCYDLFIDVILSCLHAWSKQWNEITVTTTTVEQMRLSRMYAWMIINLVYSFINLHSELSHKFFGSLFLIKRALQFSTFTIHISTCKTSAISNTLLIKALADKWSCTASAFCGSVIFITKWTNWTLVRHYVTTHLEYLLDETVPDLLSRCPTLKPRDHWAERERASLSAQ